MANIAFLLLLQDTHSRKRDLKKKKERKRDLKITTQISAYRESLSELMHSIKHRRQGFFLLRGVWRAGRHEGMNEQIKNPCNCP